jgi:hypothetical protein
MGLGKNDSSQRDGSDGTSATAAARDAALGRVRDWIDNISGGDLWPGIPDDYDKDLYANIVIDMEAPTVTKRGPSDFSALMKWSVKASAAKEQPKALPKGKTKKIGPAGDPVPPAGPGAPPPPVTPCEALFLDAGTVKGSARKEKRLHFVMDAFDAVRSKIDQYMCTDKCPDLRADLHCKLTLFDYFGGGTPTWQYNIDWKLRMYCYEEGSE